jgi:hypothetical protein
MELSTEERFLMDLTKRNLKSKIKNQKSKRVIFEPGNEILIPTGKIHAGVRTPNILLGEISIR